jgi:glycine dehydrogenase
MLTSAHAPLAALENATAFASRHIGPGADDEATMLAAIGPASRRALIEAIVPAAIARTAAMDLPAPVTEEQALAELKAIAGKNQRLRSFIGQGYYGTTRRASSCATSWRTPPGTPPTRPTRPRSPRAAWRRWSTSRPW